MKTIQKIKVHDFRVLDQVLYESDPDAGNVVFVGPDGGPAYPFAVARRVSGPGGWYVDTCEILAAGKYQIATWDTTFEVDGESISRWVVDTKRHVELPGSGNYTVRYSAFGEKILDVDFQVILGNPPYGAIVPGPVDAALSKGTICWVGVDDAKGHETTRPVWYGYEGGNIYVLVGGDEQKVPGLLEATHARLLVRSKDKQSLVGSLECGVRKMAKGAEWEQIARDVLLGRRLNLPDGEKAVDRWRRDSEIAVLNPLAQE